MTLPYYARKQSPVNSPELGLLLDIPELKKNLGHILERKNIGLLPIDYLGSISSAYHFASHSTSGLNQWVRIVEIYFELIKLCVALNKYNEMFNIYICIMSKIFEGQQDLYNCQEQVDAVKNKDVEIYFKALVDKYFSLYEHNIRYTLSLAIYCLDLISNHKDASKKNAENYCDNDLSYKLEKIETCLKLKFRNDLNNLKLGIEHHIRNAIAHKKYEYGEIKNMIFYDRGGWKAEYKIEVFKELIEKIQLNFHAQGTALQLFMYEYEDLIDKSTIKPYQNVKQLKTFIVREINDSYFIPKDIRFEGKSIICDVEKKAGFDYPSSTMGNINGMRFYSERKDPLKADLQALRVIHGIALLETDFEVCRINIVDYLQKPQGSVEVNLKKWTELVRTKYAKKDLDRYIVINTFLKDT